MDGEFAVLAERGVLEVSGPEARPFLQRLITNDVGALGKGEARYAALLSPQGKILSDFLVVDTGDGFLIDAPSVTLADLVAKLNLYRLRAKALVADRSDTLAVIAFPANLLPAAVVQAYDDPRANGLWRRAIVRRQEVGVGSEATRETYEAARITSGVPEGGLDFAFGEAFPHDANLDQLHGIDFRKGCYIGQEVVSRVEHRGTARKRVVAFTFVGEPPAVGSAILSRDAVIGTFGSSIGGHGLGLVRVDRLEDAVEGELTAGGVALRTDRPR